MQLEPSRPGAEDRGGGKATSESIKTTWVQRQQGPSRMWPARPQTLAGLRRPGGGPTSPAGEGCSWGKGPGEGEAEGAFGGLNTRRQTGRHRPRGSPCSSARALTPRNPGALGLGSKRVPPTEAHPLSSDTSPRTCGRSSSLRAAACAPHQLRAARPPARLSGSRGAAPRARAPPG